MTVILYLVIPFIILSGCSRVDSNQQASISTPTPHPSQTNLPSLQPSTTPISTTPEKWTTSYDQMTQVSVAYPVDYTFRPASNLQGEAAIYSFDPAESADTGGIAEDELKIAITYFGAEDERSIDFDSNNILDSKTVSVDGFTAITRDLEGRLGNSRTTVVEINKNERYVITALPLESELIDVYEKFLESIDLQATSPVILENISAESVISSPLRLQGKIPGTWLSEGATSVKLLTASGNVVSQARATTQQDWMTEDKISFSTEIEFDKPDAIIGFIAVEKSNPSGLPENASTFYHPIRFE